MFRKQSWLVECNKVLETCEMLAVEGRGTAYGQTHSVDRQRIVSSNTLEQVMWRATITHVVLGVNLEKVDATGAHQNVLSMFGLEANTGPRDGNLANVRLR